MNRQAERDLKQEDDRQYGMGCPFGHGVPVAAANPGPHGEGQRPDPFVPLDPADMMRDKSKEFYIESPRAVARRLRRMRDLEEGSWLFNMGRMLMGKQPNPEEGPKIWKILCIWSLFMFMLILLPLLYILLSKGPDDPYDDELKHNETIDAMSNLAFGEMERIDFGFVPLELLATPSESGGELGPDYSMPGSDDLFDFPTTVTVKNAGVLRGLSIMITAIVVGVVALCSICICLTCCKIRSWQRASRRSSAMASFEAAQPHQPATGQQPPMNVTYYPPPQQIEYPHQQVNVVYPPDQAYPSQHAAVHQQPQPYPAPNYPQVNDPTGRPGKLGFEGLHH